MQTGRAHGMMTFESAIHELIQKGLISKEDGLSFLRRRSAGKQISSSPPHAPRLPTSPAIN